MELKKKYERTNKQTQKQQQQKYPLHLLPANVYTRNNTYTKATISPSNTAWNLNVQSFIRTFIVDYFLFLFVVLFLSY